MLVTAEQGFGWWNSCTLYPTVTYFLHLLVTYLLTAIAAAGTVTANVTVIVE
jgi:hypothetical protein